MAPPINRAPQVGVAVVIHPLHKVAHQAAVHRLLTLHRAVALHPAALSGAVAAVVAAAGVRVVVAVAAAVVVLAGAEDNTNQVNWYCLNDESVKVIPFTIATGFHQ